MDSAFGDANDAKASGGKDVAELRSKIGSVTIAGQALGTVSGTDHFGIVAEQLNAVKIGGTPLPLTLLSDDLGISLMDDFRVNELG